MSDYNELFFKSLLDSIESKNKSIAIFLSNQIISNKHIALPFPNWIRLKLIRYLVSEFEINIANFLIKEFEFSEDGNVLTTEWFEQVELVEFYMSENINSYISLANVFKDKNIKLIYPDLVDRITKALKNKYGFSFVRFGDGEGNLMGLKFDRLKNIRSLHSRQMSELQFGTNCLSSENQLEIADYLIESINTVDVLGIMTPETFVDKFTNKSLPYSRQLAGNIENYLVLESLNNLNRESIDYIDSSINYDPAWEAKVLEIAIQLGKISIIGPHPDIYDFFINRGLTDVQFIQIPGEMKYFPSDKKHFQDVLPDVRSKLLEKDLSGRLFLVGAGLLGKYYCHLIKSKNGVALDIGSTMDRLCGHGFTRVG